MNANIIIAHYKEDLSWVNQIKNKDYNVFIYSKSDEKIESINAKEYNYMAINKGCEATAYLSYIIGHYDDLADKNLFLHGHRSAFHIENSEKVINNINWSLSNYFSVATRNNYYEQYAESPKRSYIYSSIKSVWYLFEKYLGEFPSAIHCYCCANFQADRQAIRQYPKEYYEYLYNWIMETNSYDSKWLGVIFEHMWAYLLTKNNIEKKYDNFYAEEIK